MQDLTIFEPRGRAGRQELATDGARPVLNSISPVELRGLVERAQRRDPDYTPGPALARLIGSAKAIRERALARLVTDNDDGKRFNQLLRTWWLSKGRDERKLDVLLGAAGLLKVTRKADHAPSDAITQLFELLIWPALASLHQDARPLTFPPALSVVLNPFARLQGHLNAGPVGVGANSQRHYEGDRGEGCVLVDVEQGWALGHPDLVGLEIELIRGRNASFHSHGTNTLGVIAARDNTVGGVGVAPNVRKILLSSEDDGSGIADTANAILVAISRIGPGDVLLIESQALRGSGFVPVEFDDIVYEVIRLATASGIVVIEPSGNGGQRLDGIRSPTTGTRVFDRSVRDSGAIVVGAASATVPHLPLPFTNTGTRLDCFAWGEGVITTGGDAGNSLPGAYNFSYGGTSAGAAILAGVVLVLQGIAKESTLGPLAPRRLREIVSDPSNGTASLNRSADGIGVMPDLKKILENEGVWQRLEPKQAARAS